MTKAVSVRATPARQAADRYTRVPFQVETGTTSIEVTVEVDDQAAVIDLGCEAPAGWRGWSGGARRSFVITESEATPGYHPGPLEAGEWSVVLGLHMVPAEGTEVRVAVTTPAVHRPDPGPPAEVGERRPRGSSRRLPAPAGLTWYAGDFHAHSTHSDGSLGLEQLAALAARAGLDFLAVTEHNTTSHHRLLPALGERMGLTLLPGQEVTTHQGHANAFGDIGFVDFRQDADHWIRTVQERGGILSVNHPVDGDCAWTFRTSGVPGAAELWHATWYRDLAATFPFAWFERWDRSVTLLGGGDFHDPAQGLSPGLPTTWVAAEDASVEAILDAVRHGRTAITGGAVRTDAGYVPDLLGTPVLLRDGADLVAVDARGTVLVDGAGRRTVVESDHQSWPFARQDGPFRLVAADRTILALSA